MTSSVRSGSSFSVILVVFFRFFFFFQAEDGIRDVAVTGVQTCALPISLSLSGLALAANDLADRSRMKKLNPDEVTGGTFTITNPGVFGGLFGTPIINQPQVAILCVGTIEKRPKVFTSPEGDDYIAIRHMAYFALTYDHRIVDGADAERFLSYMKESLENGSFGS